MPGDGLPESPSQHNLFGGKAQRHRLRRLRLFLLPAAMVTLLAGCRGELSVLNPGGPVSARIAALWWILLGIATVVFLIVVGYFIFGVTRQFHEDRDEAARERMGNRIVVIAGIIVPGIILLFVLFLALGAMRALAEPELIPESQTIQVTGNQWWWEVTYPGADVVTANEIHIPAGRPVRILLDTDDVIHSFWVPNLHGKLDLVPGRTNEMWIQADEPGIYRGACAEFCGRQHAKMQFVVVAEPLDQYQSWLEAQAAPARAPTDPLAMDGVGVFMLNGCAQCHTIRGTPADGDIGPDLTHIASRLTLAAGSLPNTRGHLAGWITDPQHNKPGVYMPPTNLDGDELEALLAYLASLE